MLLTTQEGEYRLLQLPREEGMHQLYEAFVRQYYKKKFPELKVHAAQIPWGLDEGSGSYLPCMQSDITIQKGNKVLIIDTKYYTHTMQEQYGVRKLRSAHLYQIFTYVKNKVYAFGEQESCVSGLLLYARTDEAIQPDETYCMHGNQIEVKTLDLSCPFSVIEEQLQAIVRSYFYG